MKRVLSLFVATLFILVIFGSLYSSEVQAASLGNLKDVITTSRPSASSPLSANAAAGAGAISIFNNGSRYLASDSATIIRTAGGVATNVGLNVASQSAALTTVFLGSATGTFAGAGADVLIVPITARHTITFNAVTAIPASGKIVVQFPGAGLNTASPSATTFAFNNLVTGNVTVTGATCSGGSLVVTAPNITCTTSTPVTAGATVTITVGATTPALINPTKTITCASGALATCTADTWKVFVITKDASDNELDNASAKIATIESVQVQATVEPSLTFTITGLANGTDLSVADTTTSCGAIVTNTGIDTEPTSVNLGILSNAYVSNAAQQLGVATNGATGYAITATSSGQLRNPAGGTIILDANGGTGLTANDTAAPAAIVAGTAAFGIHACGPRSSVNTNQWVNAGDMTTARFSNPWNTGTNAFYNTIASYSGGPVQLEYTFVDYAATISGVTPAGTYITTLTYVASATF